LPGAQALRRIGKSSSIFPAVFTRAKKTPLPFRAAAQQPDHRVLDAAAASVSDKSRLPVLR
jgi:hypothetical protein